MNASSEYIHANMCDSSHANGFQFQCSNMRTCYKLFDFVSAVKNSMNPPLFPFRSTWTSVRRTYSTSICESVYIRLMLFLHSLCTKLFFALRTIKFTKRNKLHWKKNGDCVKSVSSQSGNGNRAQIENIWWFLNCKRFAVGEATHWTEQ